MVASMGEHLDRSGSDDDLLGRVRRRAPSAAAVLVVLGTVLLVIGLATGDEGPTELATDPDATVTSTAPSPTDEPEVLGDATRRDPGDDGAVDDGPGTTDAPSPGTVASPTTTSGAPATTAPATTAPTTTTTAAPCLNSTDPACGPFRWEPQPSNRPASLTVRTPPTVVAGEAAPLELQMSDPDGPVTLSCYSVALDRPGASTGTCVAEPLECPDRYGPWRPPAPQPGSATTTTEVTFDESGTYTVTVSVSRPDGCDTVDPYRSGATAQLTVEVQPAG